MMICKYVDAVKKKFESRAALGLKKYGITMERDDRAVKYWLLMAQEEAMDLAIYLERLIEDCDD